MRSQIPPRLISAARSPFPLQRAGPLTAEDLDSWPLDIIATLLEGGLEGECSRMRRLRNLFIKKFKLSGDYSGMECSREVVRLLKVALQAIDANGFGFDWQWVRSCEYSKAQQEYLLNFSASIEDSNSCVLCDINDRLTTHAAKELDKIEPAKHLSYLQKKVA